MQRHGQDAYDRPDATHRFSRIWERPAGEEPRPLGRPILEGIARAMTREGGPDSEVPSGYTYLGQFVAHDLSFDPRGLTRALEFVAVSELRQRRSPSLDLDSLYGDGPDELVVEDGAARLWYEGDGARLREGVTTGVADRFDEPVRGFDLPRDWGLAAIPDPRNDENLVVAQLHLAFIRFHNAVVERLRCTVPREDLFRRARELVVRHYQWILRGDFLPRVVNGAVLDAVFGEGGGRRVVEPDASPDVAPTMPLEFSAAAYRFGHSMARDAYDLNRILPSASLAELFQLTGALRRDIGGRGTLPSSWIVQPRPLLRGQRARAGQPRPPHRHAAQPRPRQAARRRAGRWRAGRGRSDGGQPRLPQPHPRRRNRSRDRPADVGPHARPGAD